MPGESGVVLPAARRARPDATAGAAHPADEPTVLGLDDQPTRLLSLGDLYARTFIAPHSGLEAALVNAVTIGVPLRAAGELASVPYDTVLRWMQRGEGRHPTRRATAPYVQFVQAIKKAQAADQARRIARIEQAARGGHIREEHTRTIDHKDGTTTTVREVRYAPPQWQADAWHLDARTPRIGGAATASTCIPTKRRLRARPVSSARHTTWISRR